MKPIKPLVDSTFMLVVKCFSWEILVCKGKRPVAISSSKRAIIIRMHWCLAESYIGTPVSLGNYWNHKQEVGNAIFISFCTCASCSCGLTVFSWYIVHLDIVMTSIIRPLLTILQPCFANVHLFNIRAILHLWLKNIEKWP